MISPEISVLIHPVISQLKRRQIAGSHNVALEISHTLMRVISAARWSSPSELITIIRQVGKQLIEAQPREFSTGNIVRRVLALIREEMDSEKEENAPMISSMFSLLSTQELAKTQLIAKDAKLLKKQNNDLRSVIIQGIRDLIDEVTNINEGIETMSVDLIHDNEILLTPTPNSNTVLQFLIKARQKRKFTVLVTECFPNDTVKAHQFAKTLAEHKIETIIIPDTTVYAVMSRVGKVIVGARSVFANGGCVTTAGVSNVVEAASAHRTPVFVVAGLYKISPNYPFSRDELIEVGNSGKVLGYEDSDLVEKCQVTNPLFDYVDPDLIDIYITNIGGFSPSFIYRVVLDNYKTEDTNLD